MPFQEKRLVNPTVLTTSASSALYTVPTGYTAIIKQLVVTNTTASPRTFTIYIGATAVAGNALFSGTAIAASDALVINLSQVLASTEKIFALSDAGSALNLTISGVENNGPLEAVATYIADNAVTTAKIADASVTTEKIAAGISPTKIAGTSVVKTEYTAKGVALIGSGASTPTALTVGSDGTILTANSSTATGLQWKPDASGLVRLTPSSASGIDGIVDVYGQGIVAFNSASVVRVNGCFNSLYKTYKIIIHITNSNQVLLNYRLRAAGTDNSGTNYTTQRLVADNTTVAASRSASQTSGVLGQLVVGDISFFDITMYQPHDATKTGLLLQNGSFVGGAYMSNGVGQMSAASSFDGFTIFPASGTLTGTILVYGYRYV